MSELQHPDRNRALPNGAAGRLARLLRARQPQLDEFTRARMERSLVQAWQTRAVSAAVSRAGAPRGRRDRILRSRVLFPASLTVAALAGALLALRVSMPEPTHVPEGTAQFEMRLPDGAIQRGPVAEGQTLQSGRHSHIQIALGRSHVEADRETSVRFDRIDARELEFSIGTGRVEVSFHPLVRGEQHMTINTRAARIRVVGTRFTVDVDGPGNTRVRVSEGVVEVVPRHGGPAHFVRAGEDLEVMVDPGDASERAVRDALAEQLARADASTQLDEPVPEPDMDLADLLELEPEREQAAQAQVPGVVAQPSVQAGGRQLPHVVRKPLVRRTEEAAGGQVLAALEEARGLLRGGRHAAARSRLMRIARSDGYAPRHRAEAWTLMAESHTAQGNIPLATGMYQAAAQAAPQHAVGHNAQFALARLLDRYTHDEAAAQAAYRGYLARVPQGPLAAQARHALCRLGQTDACERD